MNNTLVEAMMGWAHERAKQSASYAIMLRQLNDDWSALDKIGFNIRIWELPSCKTSNPYVIKLVGRMTRIINVITDEYIDTVIRDR